MQNQRVATVIVGGILGFLFIVSTQAGPNMKPGLWEVTVKMEVPGMPMAIPPMTTQHCITKEDPVPRTQKPSEECEITDQSVSGDTVTWRVRCKSGGMTTVGTGNITYQGDSYRGSIQMQMSEGGRPPMNMTQTLSGKRIGDKCGQ